MTQILRCEQCNHAGFGLYRSINAMDPKIHEGGDSSSDSELLDNWTIVDTDEALDASLLADDEADNEQPDNSERDAPPHPEDNEQVDDNCESLKDLSLEDQEKSSIEGPLESDTDGISTFSESDGEVDDIEEESEASKPVVAPAAENGRISPGSKSLSDYSDLSSLQDMPIDLGQKGERRYVHHPSPKVNHYLNALLVVVFASVVGLGIGHFMGLQEECHVPKFAEVPETPLSDETWTLLNSLSHENDFLKMQLEELQNSIDDRKERVQLMSEPLLIKNEDSDETLAADNESNNNVPENETASSVSVEAPQETKPQEFDPADPYSDELLEMYQTRFVKHLKAEIKEQSQSVKQPEAPKAKEKRSQPQPPPMDSFYGRAEAELQNLVQRLSNYGSSIVKDRDIPQSVASGLGMLTATVADLQQSLKTLQQNTAQHSSFVVEKVKKSVSKMVSNVKNEAEKLTSGKLGTKGNFWKSMHKLKASVVNGWCHIKGKMNQGDSQECYSNLKKNNTKFQKHADRPVFKKKEYYGKEKSNNRDSNKYVCYNGKCEHQRNDGGWQFMRAQFRDNGRQKYVSSWSDRRQHKRNDYSNVISTEITCTAYFYHCDS
ncbi:Hypothetical predicted protein [Cloeon dipterum]|uniref:Uncharacterized protein n=1 Tax=Cloeon dipterum TaxID=197152 RepID=A0A8S1CN30_9INSE|nr:Hypothetical predicted protein [Cloeon dipterum]